MVGGGGGLHQRPWILGRANQWRAPVRAGGYMSGGWGGGRGGAGL